MAMNARGEARGAEDAALDGVEAASLPLLPGAGVVRGDREDESHRPPRAFDALSPPVLPEDDAAAFTRGRARRNRALVSLFACVDLVTNLAESAPFPFLPKLLEDSGCSATQRGLVFAALPLGVLVTSPLVPRVVWRVGPLPTLVGSLFALAAYLLWSLTAGPYHACAVDGGAFGDSRDPEALRSGGGGVEVDARRVVARPLFLAAALVLFALSVSLGVFPSTLSPEWERSPGMDEGEVGSAYAGVSALHAVFTLAVGPSPRTGPRERSRGSPREECCRARSDTRVSRRRGARVGGEGGPIVSWSEAPRTASGRRSRSCRCFRRCKNPSRISGRSTPSTSRDSSTGVITSASAPGGGGVDGSTDARMRRWTSRRRGEG